MLELTLKIVIGCFSPYSNTNCWFFLKLYMYKDIFKCQGSMRITVCIQQSPCTCVLCYTTCLVSLKKSRSPNSHDQISHINHIHILGKFMHA